MFYSKVSQWYELVIYTASTEEYGSKVSDFLDNGRGFLNRRFYRKVRPNFVLLNLKQTLCLKN